MLGEILPAFAHLADTVRVIDVPHEADGLVLRVLMNADLEQAVAFLSPPRPPSPRAGAGADAVERSPEDHSRWRNRMAQRIAAHLDPVRFGVVGLYLIGSAKNESADARSDIDLIVHVRGTRRSSGRRWSCGSRGGARRWPR